MDYNHHAQSPRGDAIQTKENNIQTIRNLLTPHSPDKLTRFQHRDCRGYRYGESRYMFELPVDKQRIDEISLSVVSEPRSPR